MVIHPHFLECGGLVCPEPRRAAAFAVDRALKDDPASTPKLPHSKEFSTCNAAWPRIQQQARVSRGCFHLHATMLQHDLRVLRGEFTSGQTSAVHRKQAGD